MPPGPTASPPWARGQSAGRTAEDQALRPIPPAPAATSVTWTYAAIAADPDIPRNLASREGRFGFFARLAERLGFSASTNRAALAAEIGRDALVAGSLGAGAPLAPRPADLVARFEHARHRPLELFSFLVDSTPKSLAELDRAIGLGALGGRDLSLREALTRALGKKERRAALAVLDEAFASLRRPAKTPLHDLSSDPSGLFGPTVDGRLPQTIDKLLELRRLGRMTKTDLVNRHEVTSNNRVQILAGAPEAFAEMMRAIDGANDFIHVSFFIFKNDRRGRMLADKLIEKARQGKKVRVVFDEGGMMLGASRSSRRLIQELVAAGAEVVENRVLDLFRPLGFANAPDHRKAVIVDGRIGFTGGLNIGDAYIDGWHDIFTKIEGDAVHQLNVDFLMDWLAQGGRIDPGAGDLEVMNRYFPALDAMGTTRLKLAQAIPGESREILDACVDLIDRASSSIWIENPYVTSKEIFAALLRARARGVEVHLIIPGKNNHPTCDLLARESFLELIRAGASLHAFSGMCHGKVMVVDGRYTVIGTSNLDDMSLKNTYESNLNIDCEETAGQVMSRIFLPDLARSRRLEVHDISIGDRIASRALRPFARIL